jgi:mono/diheme cytochrome c family protein
MMRMALLTVGLIGSVLGAGQALGQKAATSALETPPPGPGLSTIQERCSACHSAATVFGQRRSPDDWAATVQVMVDHGADLSADEQSVVIGYLSQNYGVKSAGPAK